MKKYLSLVRLTFIQQYRVKPSTEKNKRTGTIVAFVILGICFLPMMVGIAFVSYNLGKLVGADSAVVTVLVTTCQGLVLIFGTPSLFTCVFNGRDADRLLCLPVKSTTLFAAKLTVVYLNEVVTTAAAAIFLLLPYGIGASVSVAFYLMLPLALLLIPVLPLFVGCVVAMPFSALLARLGKNGVVRTVVQIVFFVAVIVFYVWSMSNMQGGEAEDSSDFQEILQLAVENFQSIGQKLAVLHSNSTLASALVAATLGSFALSLLLTVVENFALFAVVMLIAWPFYRWILSYSLEGDGGSRRHNVVGQPLQVKNKGVVRELVISDLKRTVRNNQMGFQAFAGIVLMPIMIVVFFFAFNSEVEDGVTVIEILKNEALYQIIVSLVIVGYMSMLGIGSNVLGLYPISRENNSLYLLKSLPISFDKILLSKVILSTAVMIVVDFLTIVLSVVLLGVKWYFGILMLATMLLLGFGGMCIMTFVDLKAPKLGWTNFNQSLKNAKNSWLAMLVGFALIIAIALISIGFILWFSATENALAIVVMWAFILGASASFAAVSYKKMAKNASYYFEIIEA